MCPKGDAGRHGTVGEKGPNGLPVGIKSVIGAAHRSLKCQIPFWWIDFDFLSQGLQGKAGAKGSKGEVVSKKRAENCCPGNHIRHLLFRCFQGDPGKPGEAGPSGEPGIPVCIRWVFVGGGGTMGATAELNGH